MKLRVLVACEESGRVREAFRALGHDAWSCDLMPSAIPSPYHHQGDAVDFLYSREWDLLIAFPPCTYLCISGVRWLYGGKGDVVDPVRWQAMKEGARFFNRFWNAPVPMIAVENPIQHRYAKERIGAGPTQLLQPWSFGHKEMKATGLWLKGLPPLQPTNVVGPPPQDPELRKHWAKVHRAAPGPNRARDRSRTYLGVAEAMAAQWGGPT